MRGAGAMHNIVMKSSSCLALMAAGISFGFFGQTAHAATPAPSCAWQYNKFTTNATISDSNADYWITPFTYQTDLTITVHGVLPAARYFSLTAYNALATAGTENVIHDTQITHSGDGSFTVTVSHSS